MTANNEANRMVKRRLQFMALVVLLACILAACAACSTGDSRVSVRDAWLQAPKSRWPRWNREPQLDRLLAGVKVQGMTRTQVIGLLGKPGHAAADYPGPTRQDEYRLSAANFKAYRIDYDQDDKAVEGMIEDGACECPFCTANAPVVSGAVLEKSSLLKKTELSTPPQFQALTLTKLDKLLGSEGERHSSNHPAGGQVWFNYSEVWRVSGAANQFFFAEGHVPFRDVEMGQIGKLRVDSWTLISYAPDCLAE